MTLLSLVLEDQAFQIFRSIVYNELATILMAITMFNIAMRMFRKEYLLSNWKSIIGQILIVIGLAGFVSSLFGQSGLDSSNPPGGMIGSFLYSFLSENLLMNFTPVFFMVILIIAIPFTIMMPIANFLDMLGGTILKGFDMAKKFAFKNKQIEAKSQPNVDVQTAATFGDFRKILGKNVNSQDDQQNDQQKMSFSKDDNDKNPNKVSASESKVVVNQVSVEGAFVNESLQYPDWKLPALSLLNPYKKAKVSQDKINKNADIIEKTLISFGIKVKVVDVIVGPSVTQYALDVALGVKVSKIANLVRNLALALATPENQVRLIFPIPGTSYIGIEIPNADRETVYIKETFADEGLKADKLNLPMAVGKTIAGSMLFVDLQKMPHVLIAGATGSGKSILTNGFIMSLLFTKTPDEVRFIMVDPKQVELAEYNGIPHLLTPVITEMDKVLNALKWAIAEMEQRYTIFRESRVKNIEGYNEVKGYAALPYIVIVIDEMADMMMSTNKVETESAIVRLAQKARATGIHLILATQRPSVNVITGLIKANIPGRIGMSVTTRIDSQVIMDQIGAEALLGKGDLLFKDPSSKDASRIQGMWVAPDEIIRTVEFIRNQVPEVNYATEVTEARPDEKSKMGAAGEVNMGDDQFANAVRVVVNARKGSTSLIQRKLSIGYNRAARLLDMMEELGVVGGENGSKPREVFIDDAEDFLQKLANGEIGSVPNE
jgi:DNA segregation ATPase FtsK/SpoIIIE, S-DNA-T family